MQHIANVERISFEARFKARRCEKVIEGHRQLKTILGGKEGIEIQNAKFLHWRILDLLDDRRQVQILPASPGVIEKRGNQDVLTALGSFFAEASQ